MIKVAMQTNSAVARDLVGSICQYAQLQRFVIAISNPIGFQRISWTIRGQSWGIVPSDGRRVHYSISKGMIWITCSFSLSPLPSSEVSVQRAMVVTVIWSDQFLVGMVFSTLNYCVGVLLLSAADQRSRFVKLNHRLTSRYRVTDENSAFVSIILCSENSSQKTLVWVRGEKLLLSEKITITENVIVINNRSVTNNIFHQTFSEPTRFMRFSTPEYCAIHSIHSVIIDCQSSLEYFWKNDQEWKFFQLLFLLMGESEGGKNWFPGLESIRNY